MDISVRELEHNDYITLSEWWRDWGFKAPPERDFLPGDGRNGYMVTVGGKDVCAGFIYETNSSVAWVNWIISNKNFREKPYRSVALDALISLLTHECREKGYKYVYSNNDNVNLINRFIDHGFNIGSSRSTELLKTWA